MITLCDRELESLKEQLQRISAESMKQTQRKHSIYNMVQKASLVIKRAERRQKNTLNF